MLELVVSVGVTFGLLALGGMLGSVRERAHLRTLDASEAATAAFPLTDTRTLPGMVDASSAALVAGVAVISTDYLKSFFAQMRNLFGGEVRSFQTLLSRARREARSRMVHDALSLGGVGVVNVRYETSMIAMGSRTTTAVEVLCYGTAVIGPPGRGPAGGGDAGATA